MAYVEFKDGRRELYTKPDQLHRLYLVWQVMSGLLRSQDQDIATYAQTVKKIHFNYREAPPGYVQSNLHDIIPQALQEWAVDQDGKPIRPATSRAWTFAKKYGLWKAGKPTYLVTGEQTVLL